MPENLKVYGIGNVLMDILVRVSDEDIRELGLAKGTMHLTDGRERQKILDMIGSREMICRCGGSAPNTVITLASLGIPAGLSGKIGPDDFGRQYERQLEAHGVASFLAQGEGQTGSSIILVTPDSERTMNTSLCINRDYSVENLNPEAVALADYFFFTGYMWDTPGQKQALLKAIEIAREAKTTIVFDAADPFAVRRSSGELLPLIRDSFDIVLANAEEGRLLFDGADPETAAVRLEELCGTAVIKDGSRGSLIRQGGKTLKIPANPVEAVDTTGAGDIYAAGLIYGLCREWDLYRSGLFASWLASRIVQVTGAQFDQEEVLSIREAVQKESWVFTE